jgi:hypothetical protein
MRGRRLNCALLAFGDAGVSARDARLALGCSVGVPPLTKHDTPQFVEFVFGAGHDPLPQSVDPLAVDGPWPDGAVVVTLSSTDRINAAGPFGIVSYTTAGL